MTTESKSLRAFLRLTWARHLERTAARLERKRVRLLFRIGTCLDLAEKHRTKLGRPVALSETQETPLERRLDDFDGSSFGCHPYSDEEIALGYGSRNDPRFPERREAANRGGDRMDTWADVG